MALVKKNQKLKPFDPDKYLKRKVNQELQEHIYKQMEGKIIEYDNKPYMVVNNIAWPIEYRENQDLNHII